MHRTNIYLDEEQVRALKHLAAEERCSLAELVRRAVDFYISEHLLDQTVWRERLDEFADRVRREMAAKPSASGTEADREADITQARKEVRRVHRASSRR